MSTLMRTPDFNSFMKQWTNGQRCPCVVCLGDSVTAGYTQSGVIDQHHAYPAQLRNMFQKTWPMVVTNVINAGVAGDSAQASLARLQRDALVHRPDVLIVAFGLNDSSRDQAGLDDFETSLKTIIQLATEQGVRWIVLVTPPMMATRETEHIHPVNMVSASGIIKRQNDGTLALYAQAIRQVGEQMSMPVADVHAQWQVLAESGVDTNQMLANGLNHPTGQAHEIHARAIFNTLRNDAAV